MTINTNQQSAIDDSSQLDMTDPDGWTDAQRGAYVEHVAESTVSSKTTVEGYYNRYTTYSRPIDDMDAPSYISDDPNAPDYRIHNNYEGEIVDNLVNYLLSQEPAIRLPDDAGTYVSDSFSTLQTIGNLHGELLEAAKYANACGTAAIIMYEKEGQDRIKPVKGYEYHLLESERDGRLHGIRYYYQTDENGVKKYYAEMYTKNNVYFFAGGGTYSGGYNQTAAQQHNYDYVPMVEIYADGELFPAFYRVRRLISAYDRLISNYSNELEDFRHAYMVLINFGVDNETMQNMRRNRAIEMTDDGDVKFLTKEIDSKAWTALKDTLEKNIERFSGTLNYADPDIYGKATNLAISTRIKPLENNAKAFGIRLKKTIYEIMQTLNSRWKKASPGIDWRLVEIMYNYDRPENNIEKIDMASKKQHDLGMAREDAWKGLDLPDTEGAIERADTMNAFEIEAPQTGEAD